MNILDYVKNCFNLYFNFELDYKKLIEETSFLISFLVYFGFSLLFLILLNIQNFWFSESQTSKFILVFNETLLGLTNSFLSIFFIYGIIYGMLQFFEGKSNFKNTLKAGLNIGVFPLIVGSIINLIVFSFYLDVAFDELSWNTFDIILAIFYSLIMIGLFIWTFIVSIKVFEKLHDLKRSKVIISLLTPIIIGFLLFGLLLGALFIFII